MKSLDILRKFFPNYLIPSTSSNNTPPMSINTVLSNTPQTIIAEATSTTSSKKSGSNINKERNRKARKARENLPHTSVSQVANSTSTAEITVITSPTTELPAPAQPSPSDSSSKTSPNRQEVITLHPPILLSPVSESFQFNPPAPNSPPLQPAIIAEALFGSTSPDSPPPLSRTSNNPSSPTEIPLDSPTPESYPFNPPSPEIVIFDIATTSDFHLFENPVPGSSSHQKDCLIMMPDLAYKEVNLEIQPTEFCPVWHVSTKDPRRGAYRGTNTSEGAPSTSKANHTTEVKLGKFSWKECGKQRTHTYDPSQTSTSTASRPDSPYSPQYKEPYHPNKNPYVLLTPLPEDPPNPVKTTPPIYVPTPIKKLKKMDRAEIIVQEEPALQKKNRKQHDLLDDVTGRELKELMDGKRKRLAELFTIEKTRARLRKEEREEEDELIKRSIRRKRKEKLKNIQTSHDHP